jgi:hypothetical protein
MAGGQRHEFLVGRVIADRLPPGQDGGSHRINPLIRKWSDHVRATELAAYRKLDYKISVLGVTLHLEPIAVAEIPSARCGLRLGRAATAHRTTRRSNLPGPRGSAPARSLPRAHRLAHRSARADPRHLLPGW